MPVPSSRVNCNSFLDFLTASHAFTFTALKSDLLKVSKSTISSNNGSTFTLEKSIFSTVFSASAGAASEVLEAFLSASSDFIVGNSNTSLIASAPVRSIHIRSIPNPIPPVGGIPISSAFMKSSSVVLASSSPCASSSSCALKRSL